MKFAIGSKSIRGIIHILQQFRFLLPDFFQLLLSGACQCINFFFLGGNQLVICLDSASSVAVALARSAAIASPICFRIPMICPDLGAYPA